MTELDRQELSAREMYEGLLAIEFLAKSAEVVSGLGAVGFIALSACDIIPQEYAVLGAMGTSGGIVLFHRTAEWAHRAAERHLANVVPNPTLDKR